MKRDEHVVAAVGCPACDALVTVRCRVPSGASRSAHTARWTAYFQLKIDEREIRARHDAVAARYSPEPRESDRARDLECGGGVAA